MIKSIFIKYILAFLAVISISFTIFASVISAYIINYSIEAKQLSMATAAKVAEQYIETKFNSSTLYPFDNFIARARNYLPDELAAYAELAEDSFILVADLKGTIMLTTPLNADYIKKEYIPKEIIDRALAVQEVNPRLQTLDGVFSERHFIFTQLLSFKTGEVYGVLFFCSKSATANSFIGKIVNTIILSCLWILVATMVIIYFLTEKVVSPVRAMSKAVKSFALGRFDVRVPVKGRDEIADLAMAFNNMAASLSINDEKQRTFLSNISHDLRTPMSTIAGFIDGILDGTIPEDKHEYYLNTVTTEIRRLSRLVNSMLDITRIQAGERKLNKTNFDICETARLVLISLEQKIEAKNLEVEFLFDDEKMNVFADSDAIHQILYNLCENAIKFTYDKGLIRISIIDKEKKVYISVYNTGIGIPLEDIPFVFDRFYKTDRSRGLDKTGVGLGLFIVKTLIENHGEKIWVSSEYEKNCEFTFTLQKIHETNIKQKI